MRFFGCPASKVVIHPSTENIYPLAVIVNDHQLMNIFLSEIERCSAVTQKKMSDYEG